MSDGAQSDSQTVRRSDPVFHLIPHTHWDREWYHPLAVFQARLVPVLDDALTLLERDPDARLTLDGQTVLVEDYLALRPDAEPRIVAQVRRGALDVGPWYVLADELIPSGESLLRNLLEGARDAARLGRRLDVLYSPDAFGHPACLPALAREFGIERAALWRGLGQPAGADRDFYRWVGPDGSELLLYHLPPAGYETGIGLTRDPSAWGRYRLGLMARALTGRIAVFVGADHQAIPDLREVVPHLRDDTSLRVSTLGEFMRAIPSPVKDATTVEGELRRTGPTWVLQGVHGTRSRLKRQHGAAELRLTRIAEPLAALARPSVIDPEPALRRAWRLLLQSQFHDTLGGCCTDAVAETQARRLDDVHRLATGIAAGAMDALVGHDPDLARDRPDDTRQALVLWNPAARARGGIVTAEVPWFRRDVPVGPPAGGASRAAAGWQPFALFDSDDTVPVQVLAIRPGMERIDARRHPPDQDEVDRTWVAFDLRTVGGLAARVLHVRPGQASPATHGLEVRPDRMSNRHVELRVSSTGAIDLRDRTSGERFPGLAAVEDELDRGDTYTFSPGSGAPIRGGRGVSRAVLAAGPLVGAVETRWELAAASGGRVTLRQVVVLHADSPLVRVRLDLVNAADDHRLRLRFPVEAGAEALAGAGFGYERRPPVEPGRDPTVIERPVRTAPAHRYVAAGDGTRGLALFLPAFFEYEWTADRDLLVTLVRSVGELSRADLAERPGHAGWPEAVPLAQERGAHRIDLALAAIGGTPERPDLLEHLWEDAFLPIQARGHRMFIGNDEVPGGLSLEGEGLVVSAIRPGADGGLVLRCWNARATPVDGRWTSEVPLEEATLLRADETALRPLPMIDGRIVPFTAPPRAIVTVGVRRLGEKAYGSIGTNVPSSTRPSVTR